MGGGTEPRVISDHAQSAWGVGSRGEGQAALRIVLGCMESHANRHRRYLVPLLSVHINFYVRLFVYFETVDGDAGTASLSPAGAAAGSGRRVLREQQGQG